MQQEAGQREGRAHVVQVSSSPYLGPGSGCEGEQAATLETCLEHLWIGDVPSETGGCSHRPGPGWGAVEQALRILLCILRIPRGMGLLRGVVCSLQGPGSLTPSAQMPFIHSPWSLTNSPLMSATQQPGSGENTMNQTESMPCRHSQPFGENRQREMSSLE